MLQRTVGWYTELKTIIPSGKLIEGNHISENQRKIEFNEVCLEYILVLIMPVEVVFRKIL